MNHPAYTCTLNGGLLMAVKEEALPMRGLPAPTNQKMNINRICVFLKALRPQWIVHPIVTCQDT
ncbi:hypothetical protein IW16_14915 [Chryseobacterium vrystaatense]|uniref:Uncharacterized protein n=1 Tax=Chryseobacterium vrystaatense TaxID=307480 RepID=A0ABR4UKD5_9FLAO|nr:hypothetical protein IW16_14915 [Chryseobacterium vrystaatense]